MTKLFDFQAPMKDRYVRCNDAPFMNKKVWKAIMTRKILFDEFKKDKSNENRNFCLKLLKKGKKNF